MEYDKAMLKLYNTLSRIKETFKPLKKGEVGLYTCGPTVYWYAHIGNLRSYLFEDILKRVLQYNNYQVKHVMNITDVGHLTSDADTGEDKLEKGAKREKKTVWQIADFYTKAFKKDIKLLNIKEPDIWVKATDTIKEQINLIKILEKKGFTYKIEDGIYFDISKLKTYGRLWPKKMKFKAGSPELYQRVEMVKGKKNPYDFALWKFSPKESKRQMEWPSPWGIGFPGWHTECVVMGLKYLGIPFDIHCGGIDHILIHHTNEIAQAEAAYGKLLANYWLHGEFLVLGKEKMAKSKANIATINELNQKGFNPLAYRYLCLGTHYRKKLDFSWQALEGAQNSLNNLYQKISELFEVCPRSNSEDRPRLLYQKKFLEFINDDLDMPKALALLWQVIKDEKISAKEKYQLISDFDKVFALSLDKIEETKIPKELQKLVSQREKYRQEKKWQKADQIRKEIQKKGYQIEDTTDGPKIFKKYE